MSYNPFADVPDMNWSATNPFAKIPDSSNGRNPTHSSNPFGNPEPKKANRDTKKLERALSNPSGDNAKQGGAGHRPKVDRDQAAAKRAPRDLTGGTSGANNSNASTTSQEQAKKLSEGTARKQQFESHDTNPFGASTTSGGGKSQAGIRHTIDSSGSGYSSSMNNTNGRANTSSKYDDGSNPFGRSYSETALNLATGGNSTGGTTSGGNARMPNQNGPRPSSEKLQGELVHSLSANARPGSPDKKQRLMEKREMLRQHELANRQRSEPRVPEKTPDRVTLMEADLSQEALMRQKKEQLRKQQEERERERSVDRSASPADLRMGERLPTTGGSNYSNVSVNPYERNLTSNGAHYGQQQQSSLPPVMPLVFSLESEKEKEAALQQKRKEKARLREERERLQQQQLSQSDSKKHTPSHTPPIGRHVVDNTSSVSKQSKGEGTVVNKKSLNPFDEGYQQQQATSNGGKFVEMIFPEDQGKRSGVTTTTTTTNAKKSSAKGSVNGAESFSSAVAQPNSEKELAAKKAAKLQQKQHQALLQQQLQQSNQRSQQGLVVEEKIDEEARRRLQKQREKEQLQRQQEEVNRNMLKQASSNATSDDERESPIDVQERIIAYKDRTIEKTKRQLFAGSGKDAEEIAAMEVELAARLSALPEPAITQLSLLSFSEQKKKPAGADPISQTAVNAPLPTSEMSAQQLVSSYDNASRENAQQQAQQQEVRCQSRTIPVFHSTTVPTTNANPLSLLSSTLSAPLLNSSEVLIRVKACGVSHLDRTLLKQCLGSDQSPLGVLLSALVPFPIVPGFEVSGVVASAGKDTDAYPVGTEVVGLLPLDQDGACAEYVTTNICNIVAKPTSVDHSAACSVLGAGLKSYYAIHCKFRVRAGDSILILNGGTAMGIIAIQLALELQAIVFATVETETHRELLTNLFGKDVHIIDVATTNLCRAIMTETGGIGVDYLLESELSSVTLSASEVAQLVAPLGTWGLSRDIQIDPPVSAILLLKGISVTFLFNQAWSFFRTQQGRLLHILAELMKKLETGKLKPHFQTFPLTQLEEAINALDHTTTGSVVIAI